MLLIKMSLSASIFIIPIIIARALFLHKLPKKTFIVLWALALVKLLCPITISFKYGILSLISAIRTYFRSDIVLKQNINKFSFSEKDANINIIGQVMQNINENTVVELNLLQIIIIIGIFFFATFFLVVLLRQYRCFSKSTLVNNNFCCEFIKEQKLYRKLEIRESEYVKSPLTYGVFQPVILLPKNIDYDDKEKLKLVLLHELIHIKNFDQVNKIMLVVGVCAHWFNPLAWVMFFLANRDIELVCDDKVVQVVGYSKKSEYAYMLINMEEKRKSYMSTVSCFSEKFIEERVLSIMKNKRTSFKGFTLAVIMVLSLTVIFASSDGVTKGFAKEENNSYSRPYCSYTVDLEDENTNVNLDLKRNAVFLAGREKWNKGEDIEIKIKADENYLLNVGIVKAEDMNEGWTYDSYGLPILKKIELDDSVEVLNFEVPETAEYGIIVQDLSYKQNPVKYEIINNGNLEETAEFGENHTGKEPIVEKNADNDVTETAVFPHSEDEYVSIDINVNKKFKNPLEK